MLKPHSFLPLLFVPALFVSGCATFTFGTAVTVVDGQTLTRKNIAMPDKQWFNLIGPDLAGENFRVTYCEYGAEEGPHILTYTLDGKQTEDRTIPHVAGDNKAIHRTFTAWSFRYRLSPEGTWFLYVHDRDELLHAIDTATGRDIALVGIGRTYSRGLGMHVVEWIRDDLAAVGLCVMRPGGISEYFQFQNTVFLLDLAANPPQVDVLYRGNAVKEMALSPDRSRLGVVDVKMAEPYSSVIRTIDIPTGRVETVWNNPDDLRRVWPVKWSPSGQRIVFCAEDALWLCDVAAKQTEKILDLKPDVLISDIAFATETRFLYSVMPDGPSLGDHLLAVDLADGQVRVKTLSRSFGVGTSLISVFGKDKVLY